MQNILQLTKEKLSPQSEKLDIPPAIKLRIAYVYLFNYWGILPDQKNNTFKTLNLPIHVFQCIFD